ncbi:MAG: hypothetical protein JWO26_2612 [Rhodospirillales bacterium]|jgi:hypothetical protein|nr:hypothetical protein [Rhodospirillales bacterium]MDB5382980.1 hypothetical protein [Rhodospirillales bacterium]
MSGQKAGALPPAPAGDRADPRAPAKFGTAGHRITP